MKVHARPSARKIHLYFGIVALLLCFDPCAQAQTIAAALLCPPCAGFERLQGSIFVERGASQGQRTQVMNAVAEGEAMPARFFGRLRTAPTIFACVSEACAVRFGNVGARGLSYGNFALLLAPAGLDPVIVAHERTHIEFHDRIGLTRFLSGAVPAWFDEGLAVIVSNDPRYLRPPAMAERCTVEPAADLPADRDDWNRRAAADHALYAQAACRVFRWTKAHGGRDGILRLIDHVADGDAFDHVFFTLAPTLATPTGRASSPPLKQ